LSRLLQRIEVLVQRRKAVLQKGDIIRRYFARPGTDSVENEQCGVRDTFDLREV